MSQQVKQDGMLTTMWQWCNRKMKMLTKPGGRRDDPWPQTCSPRNVLINMLKFIG